MDLISMFTSAMAKDGIVTNAQIIADGHIHRVHVEHDPSSTANGWFVLFDDGIPSGAYGCWKRGISKSWCSKMKRDMTPKEWGNHIERIGLAKEKVLKLDNQVF